MSPIYKLDEVFNEARVPSVTYVQPAEARQLRASLRTTGKHVTLVGASGSGKSTVAEKIINEVFPSHEVHKFSGRTYTDERSILTILGKEFGEEPSLGALEPWLRSFRVMVVDDVHHLLYEARHELARMLKLWHEVGIKFFLIGIAKTSDEILGTDTELAIRNDVHTLGAQSDDFLRQIAEKGRDALNIDLSDDFLVASVAAAKGLPAIFQAICRIACVERDVEQTQSERKSIEVELAAIGRSVVRMFDPRYFNRLVGLAQGRRHARSVHSTFYEIVDTLARSNKSHISKSELYRKIVGRIENADQKKRKSTSFYRAMGSLQKAIEERDLGDILIFESDTLSIDDPVFRFYLDHVDFERIRPLVKIRTDSYEYDVAVSFAGEDRALVSRLVDILQASGLEVFYDFNESARLWGKDLEIELADIYANEARFMILCLSASYPIKDWTRFELEIGRRAATKRPSEYLLPLRIGADIPSIVGLRETIGYETLRDDGDAMRIADAINIKLQGDLS
jgi:ABC-type oligopeptide transport system ATPase subunit